MMRCSSFSFFLSSFKSDTFHRITHCNNILHDHHHVLEGVIDLGAMLMMVMMMVMMMMVMKMMVIKYALLLLPTNKLYMIMKKII